MPAALTLRIASYNIHGCIGVDRRYDPGRIAQVVTELDCGIVGLQEINNCPGRGHESLQLDHLAARTGMQAVAGMCLRRRRGEYGNGLLTRYGVLDVRRHDIGYPDREPRGVLDVDLDVDGRAVRVLVTHFGLSRIEREVQARRLAAVVQEGPDDQPLVVMGDFNEWRARPDSLSVLAECMSPLPGLPSFPSTLPVFALDRIWIRPVKALGVASAHRSNLARWASDHLPVAAELEFPATAVAPA